MQRFATTFLVFALLAGALATVVAAEDDALILRSYDVSGLVTHHTPRRGPPLGALTRHDRQVTGQDRELPMDVPGLNGDELVDLIRFRIHPASWEEQGVWLEYRRERIIVRQRPDIVREIESFLQRMDEAPRVLLSVDIREAGADGKAAPAGCKISGSTELPAGARRFFAVTNRVDYVAEYEVEIAQGSGIGDPTYDWLDEGLVVDAIAYPLLDGKRVALEASVQFCCLDEMRRMELGTDEEYIAEPFRSSKRFPMGALELPTCSHTDLHVTTIVEAGGDVLLPVVAKGRQVDLRFHVELLGAAAPEGLLDVSALTRPPFAIRAGGPEHEQNEPAFARNQRLRWLGESADAPFGTVDEVIDLVHSSVEPPRWEEGDEQLISYRAGHILTHIRPDLMAKVEAFLVAREAQALRAIVLDLAVHSVRDEVRSGPGGTLDPELSEIVTSARLHTVPGRWASLRAGKTVNYLADYDVEVAQESRIPDPYVGQGFGGLVANLRPHLPVGGRSARVDLDLLFADLKPSDAPFETGTQHTGPIEQMRQRRTRLDTTVTVPLDGTTLLDAGPDPQNPGARLVVAISVKTP